jgi:hypothetical protein
MGDPLKYQGNCANLYRGGLTVCAEERTIGGKQKENDA